MLGGAVGPPVIGNIIGNLVGEKVGEKAVKNTGLFFKGEDFLSITHSFIRCFIHATNVPQISNFG